MGNEEKPEGPRIEKAFEFDPTKTVKLGGAFAEHTGELSLERPGRPIPEEVRQVMADEQAKAEADKPGTPEAWYLAAREHLEDGMGLLQTAIKLINARGARTDILTDIRNALIKAHARWLDATESFTNASGLENQANLNETQRLIDELGKGIAAAQRQLANLNR